MDQVNPYSAPEIGPPSESSRQPEAGLIIKPTKIVQFTMFVMSCVYAAGAIFFLGVLIMSSLFLWVALALCIGSAGCLYTSYLFFTSLWNEQHLDSIGIRLKGLKSEFFPWYQIRGWQQKTPKAIIQFEAIDGRKRYLNNIGAEMDNEEIAAFLEFQIGSKLDACGEQ